jgi:hypothetical protein
MAKVYISGPMTGIPDLNFPAFEAAAKTLREMGHEPVSPSDLPQSAPYPDMLKNAIRVMLNCDQILMLEGWQKSKGAKVELYVAEAVGIAELKLPKLV